MWRSEQAAALAADLESVETHPFHMRKTKWRAAEPARAAGYLLSVWHSVALTT